jgi:hypothetical protein
MFENDRKMIKVDTSDRKCLIELIHWQNDKMRTYHLGEHLIELIHCQRLAQKDSTIYYTK